MTEFASRENRIFNGRYTTDPLRVALSLIAGSATYGILMALWYLSRRVPGSPIFPGVPIFFAISFAVWGVILILFGLPLGLLLHKLRLRHWLVSVVVGGTTTFLVVLALATRLFEFVPPIVSSQGIVLNPINWLGASLNALILGAGGTVVTLVMWRIAYRRAVPR
jgi:hypothetical protein